MPDLRTLVQRMIDSGQDRETIDAAIERFKELNPPKPEAPPAPPAPERYTPPREPVHLVSDTEPGDYWGGVKDSLFRNPFTDERSAIGAGLRGGLGFLQGAVVDIPETLVAGVKDAASLFTNPEQLLQAREAFTEGIPAVARSVYEAGERSGTDPQAFGRVLGQLTGQPALMGKYGPPVTRALGRPVEAIGRFVKEKTPVTGVLPPIARPHTATLLEKGAGATAEWIGKKMQGKPTGELKSAELGTGSDYGNVQGRAGKVPGFWTKQRSLRNPRGIGLKATAAGTPSRLQPVPYEPNPIQQDIEGAPGEFITPEPVQGNILAKPPQGVATRNQPVPFEQQGPRPVPAQGGAPGEFDLTQPIGETPAVQPDFSGVPPSRNQPIPFQNQGPRPIPEPGAPPGTFDLTQPISEAPTVMPERGLGNRPPSRLQDMPYEPTPEPLPYGEVDLGQPVEGTIPIQGQVNAPVPSRYMDMPFEPTPEPGPYGYNIDLTEPIEGTIPLGEQSEVVPSRLRDMPYRMGQEAEGLAEAAAAGTKSKPPRSTIPRSAAASKFEPSVKPEPAAPKPTEPVKTPGGDLVDPTTGELIEPPTPRTTRSKGVQRANIEPVTTAAETPESIINAADIPEATKATLLDKINEFFANPEGSASIPSWAEKVAEKLSRQGEPGVSEFSPDLTVEPENILGGAAPTFRPRMSFEDIQNRIYELMDKDAAGTLTGAELAEAQELNKQWRNHPDFNKDVPKGSFAEEVPSKKSLFKRAKEAADKFAADESGSYDPEKDPLFGRRGVADFPAEPTDLRTPQGIQGEKFIDFLRRYMYSEESPFYQKGMKTDRTNAEIIESFNNLPGDIRNGAAAMYKESQAKLANKPADVIPFGERLKNKLSDETGSVGPDTPEMIAKNKAAKEAAEAAKPKEKVVKKFAVFNPSGEKLGNITITDGQIRRIKTVAKFSDFSDEKVIDGIRKKKLADLLEEHGFTEDQVKVQEFRPSMPAEAPETKPKLVTAEGRKEPKESDALTEVPTEELKPTPAEEAKTAKAKATKEKSEKMEPIPEEFAGAVSGSPGVGVKAKSNKGYSSSTSISEGAPKEKVKVDPEEAFRPGGDIKPIRDIVSTLGESVPDEVYKGLLPEKFKFDLAEGETFKKRVIRLMDAFTEGEFSTFRRRAEIARENAPVVSETDLRTAAAEAKRVEREKFIESVLQSKKQETAGAYEEAIKAETPLLRTKDVNKPKPEEVRVEGGKRVVPRVRGPLPPGARITLKKPTPQSVKAVEDAGFIHSGRFSDEGYPIYVKRTKFSDKSRKAGEGFDPDLN